MQRAHRVLVCIDPNKANKPSRPPFVEALNQPNNMKPQIYTRTWDYESELKRRDAPEDGIGNWLDEQTVEIAWRETGLDMVVDRTELIWDGLKPIRYVVELKQRFA